MVSMLCGGMELSAPETTSIRDTLKQESAGWLMLKANPGAWLRQEFVVRKGKEYVGRPLPAKYPKMASKHCFHNAGQLVRRRRNLRYVEGFITDDGMPMTIHHAWVIDAEDGVIDPTLATPETWQYMGVAFTADEYRAARIGRKTPALLVDQYDLVDVSLILRYCPELRDLMSAEAVAALVK